MKAEQSTRQARGLSLLSGGLDSTLAICVLRAQGVAVEAVVFESPFFSIRAAQRSAAALGVPLHVVDFTADIICLIQSPPHGFGSCLNPCIDCHARMLQRAGELMRQGGYDFVATGEVLDQRPMSQNRRSLRIVAEDAGLGERLVRPLSARLLDPSGPEREGLLDRARLLGLNGRSRRAQIQLAAQYGVKEYPSPAGGCLLTEPNYCRRLRDLMQHEGLGELRRVRLLKLGRHLRLPGGATCIAGRDAQDNAALEAAATPDDVLIWAGEIPGPTLLLPGGAGAGDMRLAVAICVAFGDGRDRTDVRVCIAKQGKEEAVLSGALPREQFEKWMV